MVAGAALVSVRQYAGLTARQGVAFGTAQRQVSPLMSGFGKSAWTALVSGGLELDVAGEVH